MKLAEMAHNDRQARAEHALRANCGNVSRAARELGVPRRTLCHWISAYEIDVERYRRAEPLPSEMPI